MTQNIHKGQYASKHPAGTEPDHEIVEALKDKIDEGSVTCAAAFGIAEKLNVEPRRVGMTIDLLNIKISKCQLGLFGYEPNKSVVQPAKEVSENLRSAIHAALADGRLPCATAWKIARNFKIKKMDVSSACEMLGLKIKPCQLGSF